MVTQLRAIWASINASYWFLPALFSLLALALALGCVTIDRLGHAEFLRDIPWLELARPDGAARMLTVIAGSMIGVASTVFSITIAAVAYASGNYGPRLLTNFMEDRGNQLSLAVFIATFVYALVVLGFIREGANSEAIDPSAIAEISLFVPQLSLLVAYALMGLSIATLVFFLNHIPASIRINTVLQGIGKRLIGFIEENYPNPDTGAVERQSPEGEPVCAAEAGYIQIIDYEALDTLAKQRGRMLKLAVRTGDFIHPEMQIAYWSGDAATPDCADDVRDCFALGGMRTPGQDIHFLIDELVEIGLRALSPGINDPFTAITTLHWLGAATAELGRRDLTRAFGNTDDPKEDRLVLLDDDFAHYLARGFGTIRSGVATSPAAAKVMLTALVDLTTTIDDESRHADVMREGERLMLQAREHLVGPSLEELEARYVTFQRDMER